MLTACNIAIERAIDAIQGGVRHIAVLICSQPLELSGTSVPPQ